MLRKLGGVSVAAISAMLLTSCSSVPATKAKAPSLVRTNPDDDSAKAPVPGRTLAKLPSGEFYFLAGPTPSSCNVWEARSSGADHELTHNGELGISSFGAATQGIVVADATNGADELAQVTAHGVKYLPTSSREGHGETPAVDNNGSLAYQTPPYHNQFFELLSRSSFRAKARTFYHDRLPLSTPEWGPSGKVAVVSERYATATTKAKSWLMVISRKSEKVNRIPAGLTQFDYAVWGPHAPGIVISPWAGGAEYIGQVRHLLLPRGWAPLSWSPNGHELLVMRPTSGSRPEELGLWTNRLPRDVTLIGPAAAGTVITEATWLTKPASLK